MYPTLCTSNVPVIRTRSGPAGGSTGGANAHLCTFLSSDIEALKPKPASLFFVGYPTYSQLLSLHLYLCRSCWLRLHITLLYLLCTSFPLSLPPQKRFSSGQAQKIRAVCATWRKIRSAKPQRRPPTPWTAVVRLGAELQLRNTTCRRNGLPTPKRNQIVSAL